MSACLSLPEAEHSHQIVPIRPGYPDTKVYDAFLGVLPPLPQGKYLVVTATAHPSAIDRSWVERQLQGKFSGDAIPPLDSLANSYATRNSSSHDISTSLGSAKIKVVGEEELGALAVEALHGRERLLEKFPNADAVAEISLPGYSADWSWAILTVFMTRGPFTGEQNVVLLRQYEGRWKVAWRDVAWAT